MKSRHNSAMGSPGTRHGIGNLKIRLIHRKEQWTLTWQGWIITLLSISTLTIVAFTNLYPFLAFNQPIAADVLVVEGWMPDSGIKAAIDEFKTGNYRFIIATGTPFSKGYYLSTYGNFAQLTVATFIKLGFNPNQLIAVPTETVKKDRTYASALAVREWLLNSDLNIKSLNLYSLGPHTRRSWLLFKAALAPEYRVGAIAATPEDYDAKTWWESSEGVRIVIGEAIAYLYARFTTQ